MLIESQNNLDNRNAELLEILGGRFPLEICLVN